MRNAVLAIAAVSTALTAIPVRAEPLVLKASSPWNVDFGEDKCRLTRFFGEEDDKHVLIFEQYWPEDSFGMTAAGNSFKRFRGEQPTDLSFLGDDAFQSTRPFSGTLSDYGEALVFSRVRLAKKSDVADSPIEPLVPMRELDTALAQNVARITFKQRSNDVQLLTGSLRDAFEVLNMCTNDLVTSWGLDAEAQRAASRRPHWTNQELIARKIQEAYPSRALSLGEQAILKMRIVVDEKGAMEDCVIIQTTAAITETLESPACQAMKRAKFEPALDAQGQPMRSYYVTSITYRIS